MWSSLSIPGAPRILMVDATVNLQGWEHAFSDRLFASLQRTEMEMLEKGPTQIREAPELISLMSASVFNCLILIAHTGPEQNSSDAKLSVFWKALRKPADLPLFLLAVCSYGSCDLQVSEEVLKSSPAVAPLAIVPISSVVPREAGLFYLKFFTELKLHSTDSISSKMVWFSFTKARELLRRRRYSTKFDIRC